MTKTTKESPSKKLVRNKQNRASNPPKPPTASPKKKPPAKSPKEPSSAKPPVKPSAKTAAASSVPRVQTAPKKKQPDQEDDTILKKPGQRRQEPSLDDPTRAFYESLHEQNPQSQMAKKYCLEYGLLDEETAVKVMAEIKRLKA
jgi:hypothetical protein